MDIVKVTIAISKDTHDRTERLAPKKAWGENHKQQFYTNIFMKGLESPDYLKAENRRLEKLLELTRRFLKPEDQSKSEALNDLARQMGLIEDMARRKAGVVPSNGNGAV